MRARDLRSRSATTAAAIGTAATDTDNNTNTNTNTAADADADADADAAAPPAAAPETAPAASSPAVPPRSSLDSAGPHVSYNLASDAGGGSRRRDASASHSRRLHLSAASASVSQARSDTEFSRDDRPYSPGATVSSTAGFGLGAAGLRRGNRATNFKTYDGTGEDDYDIPFCSQLDWQPGAEPGYDPKLPDGGHASVPTLSAPCQITVVDFSSDQMRQRYLDNDGFIEFLQEPKPDWAKCRWININGLSWDVIQAVGATKGLHKLAIEDVMNLRNRTKVDWYPHHAFIVMTLQKLVHVVSDDNSSFNGSTTSRRTLDAVRKFFSSGLEMDLSAADLEKKTQGTDVTPPLTDLQETSMPRTLQRYQASGNEVRTQFMEEHSSLAPYHMAISAEQVGVFLTSDNTVVSFFEASAGDVERPIVKRLTTPGTILRDSCDASLLVQGIMDAIIDLAIPLTAAYTDILGDLELDVISAPSIKQSKRLYICISEINKMLRFLLPIDNLVNVLRDHRTFLTQEQASRELTNPASGVLVTPMTHTYLGDVLDHSIILTESLQQLKQSSENLINLIFNTIAANQNESMKQLTTVTIIFLPLTFITGFFGQNFDGFPEIRHGIWYFWACAVPTAIATVVIVMREMLYDWAVSVVQRQRIMSIRRRRRRRNHSR